MVEQADLKECRNELFKIMELDNLINSAYRSIHSPAFNVNDAGKKNVRDVSNPTTDTIKMIDKLKEERDQRKVHYTELANKIMKETLKMQNRRLASILNCYFVEGKKWATITKELFPTGYSYDYARIYYNRHYLNK